MLTRVDAPSRRRFAGLAVVALLASAGLTAVGLATAGPAAAQSGGGCGGVTQPVCDGWVEEPGNPGGPGDDGGGGGPGPGNGGGGSAAPCYRNGVELPCYDEIVGWFNREDGCYYKVAAPQPEPGREGQTAYHTSCIAGQSSSDPTWLADPPPGFEEPPPNPEELRQYAYAQIEFDAPVIHTAPGSGKAGLVGLPVWIWSQPNRSVWGPLEGRESDRDVSVRVEAKVAGIEITMGNGDTVTCAPDDVFTAFDPDVHDPWEPDCGYVQGYPAPDSYQVVASVRWDVSWYINDEFQDIFDSVTTTNSDNPAIVEIDELQVVRE